MFAIISGSEDDQLRSTKTPEAADDKQGEMLGLFESINSLMFGVMPIIATVIYASLYSYSFLLWGALAGVGGYYLATRCTSVLNRAESSG